MDKRLCYTVPSIVNNTSIKKNILTYAQFQKRNINYVIEFTNKRTVFAKPTNGTQVISHMFHVSLLEQRFECSICE